jgi:hypothetical protein
MCKYFSFLYIYFFWSLNSKGPFGEGMYLMVLSKNEIFGD